MQVILILTEIKKHFYRGYKIIYEARFVAKHYYYGALYKQKYFYQLSNYLASN